ncbi:MAG: RDD family protein [Defluviitaleaceae bacterium]|nr:RDD family protein [Defluviitaleaceae bacterium]
MKTFTIITPSNIEVEYRLAGAGSRFAAYIIDFAIQILLIVTFAVIALWFFDRIIFDNTDSSPSGMALGAFLVFSFVVQFGYFIFCELTMMGQSIGKKIFALRVIRENGQPLGFSQSLVRGLLRASLDMMYVGLFIILFSKNHKRLGDMAAGTIVISEHHKKSDEPSLLSTNTVWPSFLPDPYSLTPEERSLTEEWLSRRDEMNDGGASVGDKLAAYYELKYPRNLSTAPSEITTSPLSDI